MKILKREQLWEGRFLRTVRIHYETRCGESLAPEVRLWESVERINCDGIVGIIPFTADGEVILIRQYRPPVDRHVVELPAGLIEIGENPETAVQRELREETGYQAGKIVYVTKGPMSSGASSEILNVFVATELSYVGIADRDETENIEVLVVPLGELNKALLKQEDRGDYIDLKVVGLIMLGAAACGLSLEGDVI